MNQNYLEIANSWVLWVAAAPAVATLLFVAIKYTKLSFERGQELDLDRKQCMSAFRVGCYASLGPGVAIFAVMVALMAVLGGPFAWMRLSILGTATTEMLAASVGAQAAGATVGDESYDTIAFAASVWTITLNTLGWVFFVFFFTHRMEKIKAKINKIDTMLMGIIGMGALLGSMSYFGALYGFSAGKSPAAAITVAIVVSVIISNIAKKHKKLEEFNIGIAMVMGMAAGQICM